MSEVAIAPEPQVTPPETQAPAVTDSLEESQDTGVQIPAAEGDTDSDAAADDEDAPLKKAIETAKAQAAEETEARVKRETEVANQRAREAYEIQAYQQGAKRAYDEAVPKVRAHLDAVIRGEQDLNVNGVLNEINNLSTHQAAARDAVWENGIFAWIEQGLGAEAAQEMRSSRNQGKLTNFGEVLTDIKARIEKSSREGHYSKAQFDAEVALEVKKGVDKVKRELGVPTSTTGNSRSNGATKLYSAMTTEEREALSPADRDRLVAEQYRRS